MQPMPNRDTLYASLRRKEMRMNTEFLLWPEVTIEPHLPTFIQMDVPRLLFGLQDLGRLRDTVGSN